MSNISSSRPLQLQPRMWQRGCLAALLTAGASLSAAAQTLPGTFSTAWVGNTNGMPADHVTHSIKNAFVLPSGKVFAITDWDEGGANVSLFQNGQVGPPFEETGTGSWGRSSGEAITADDTYVYQAFEQESEPGYGSPPSFPVPGTSWYCVRRYLHTGAPATFAGGYGYENSTNGGTAGSMLKVSEYALPVGLAVVRQQLFVADSSGGGSIRVYDAGNLSQTPLRTFPMADAGLLAADSQGYLWMLQKTQRKLVRFSASGALQAQQIALPAGIIPTAFCIDRNDRLLLTDASADLNIKIYENLFGTPTQTGTFGTTGGIYSGSPGVEGPLKFTYPTGVGTDGAGNIYVSNSAPSGGASMESYSATGALNWRLNGLVFTAVGDLDPATMSDVYLYDRRFKVDLSPPRGTAWSPYSFTQDIFRYPNDPRGAAANIFMTSGLIRRVGGQQLLYTSDMYASMMAVFRFDGAIAVPAGYLTAGSSGAGAWPPQHPLKQELVWVDKDGDGQMTANEYEAKNSDNEYGRGWWVDEAGGIWKTLREAGLRYYPCLGLDAYGVPQYSFATSILYPIPANTFNDVQRVYYDAAQDVLYLTGWVGNENSDVVWSSAGSTLRKFSRWRAGNRTPDWTTTLAPLSGPANNLAKSFVVEGDYAFVTTLNLDNQGTVKVYNVTDGQLVGTMQAGPEVGEQSGWMDINIAITARRRSTGEYVILLEENSNAKVLIYRWHPGAALTLAPPSDTPAQHSDVGQLFPNPARDQARLRLWATAEETVRADVLDGLGQRVASVTHRATAGWNDVELVLGALPTGVYTVRVQRASGKPATYRLVVMP